VIKKEYDTEEASKTPVRVLNANEILGCFRLVLEHSEKSVFKNLANFVAPKRHGQRTTSALTRSLLRASHVPEK
jgi:hypothetical protein